MRKQTRTLLILLAGILTLAVVVLTSCENPMMSHIIRTRGFEQPTAGGGGASPWTPHQESDSTARIKIAYNKKNNEATITISGAPEPNGPTDWNRWKTSAFYDSSNITVGNIYSISFEAMYEGTASREINVQYGYNNNNGAYLQQQYNLQNTYQQYQFETITIPSGSQWAFQVDFQCADALGTFKIRNVHIDPLTPGLVYDVRGTAPNYYYAVTGYNGTSANVSIPNWLHNFQVREIADYAFDGNPTITSVDIPSSVTSIEAYAFRDTTNLNTITLGDWAQSELQSVGDYAFYNSGLTDIVFNQGAPANFNSIGEGAFGYTNITAFDLTGTNVTVIPTGAFVSCAQLTSVVLGNNITSIGAHAFDGCTGLTALTIPASVTSIGESAFENVTGITTLDIPDTVTSVGPRAFAGWTDAQTIRVSWSFGNQPSGWSPIWYNGSSAVIEYPATATEGLTFTFDSVNNVYTVSSFTAEPGFDGTLVITATYDDGTNGVFPVAGIDNNAFSSNTDITSVQLPTNVEFISIGAGAFTGCTSLTEIVIPANVTTIGGGAFNTVTDIEFADGTITIRDFHLAFPVVESVTIPASATSIANDAFSSCISLEAVTFGGNNLLTIGDNAFSGCTALDDITLPTSLTTIGAGAFMNTTSLTTLDIPASVTSVGSNAFNGWTSAQTINIAQGSNYESWVSGWDTGCSATINTPVVLPTAGLNFTYVPGSPGTYTVDGFIADGSFDGHIIIPTTYDDEGTNGLADVTEIAANVFSGITAITNVSLPANLTTIGAGAFSGTNLTNLHLPTTVNDIGANAFDTVNAVTFATGTSVINDYHTAFSSSALNSVTIPTSVNNIAASAFSGLTNLTSITLPGGVTAGANAFDTIASLSFASGAGNSINDNHIAFSSSALNSVTIPDGYVTIAANAFQGLTGVTNITLPASFSASSASISIGAFPYVTNLTFAEGIITIRDFHTAFDATKLARVNIPTSVQAIETYAFQGMTALTNVQGLSESSVATIGNGAFGGCTSLTTISLPDSLTSIGISAFNGSGLTSIALPSSLQTINNNAFAGTSLTTITLPPSVTTVGTTPFPSTMTTVNFEYGTTTIRAFFKDNTNIATVYLPETTTNIVDEAFSGCIGLTDLYVDAQNPPTLAGANVFDGISSFTIHVYSADLANYTSDIDWSSITGATIVGE